MIERLKSAARMARDGAQVFRSTGLLRELNPLVGLKLLRDLPKGRRGSLAVIHLHALADAVRPALVSLPRPGAPTKVGGAEGAVSGQTEMRLSYGELEERVNRLSHVLLKLGIQPGDRLGALLFNGHEYIELNAAMSAVAGVAVQIGYRSKGAEVAYLLENSGAKALLFHGELLPVVEEALQKVKLPPEKVIAIGGGEAARKAGFRSYEELLSTGDARSPAIVTGGGYGGLMVYTSGTTGKAKGATRDFKNMGYEPVLSFLSQFPISRDDRHLVVSPLYHSAAPAFVAMIMGVGGCVVIAQHFDPEESLRTIERERITSAFLVPTMLARLVQLPAEVIRRYDTSSLKWIMSGAAPLPTDVARRFEDTFGPILYNFYGATETGLVTLAKPGEHTARPGTIGRVIGGNEIKLLDEQGREVPEGKVGELFTRNGMLMDGYHKNAEATRAAMKEGFLSVGDMAWRDGDGFYYLADRKSDMVISGGVNIYPWEIEQRLHEHQAVHEAAVVGVPDPEWGESLVAFVVLEPGRTATAEELQNWVTQTLANFKRPKRIEMVDALPRNPTGKVLKRELKQRAASGS